MWRLEVINYKLAEGTRREARQNWTEE